jgi:hypothetical protein
MKSYGQSQPESIPAAADRIGIAALACMREFLAGGCTQTTIDNSDPACGAWFDLYNARLVSVEDMADDQSAFTFALLDARGAR